jgi:hypothetical protein
MTKPGDPSNGPAPTPRPTTPALVRSGVAVLALGLAGCGGAEPVPPQVPPQLPPQDVTIPVPPQAAPPQNVPPQMPPQVAPQKIVPPQAPPPVDPKHHESPPPNQR